MVSGTNSEPLTERLREILATLDEKLVARLPEPLRGRVREEIAKLEEVIMDAREPRFAFVGRRGAGKSSLINAIFEAEVAKVGSVKSTTGIGRWYDYEHDGGKISVLDTRGLGEGSRPDAEVQASSGIEEVRVAIDERCPDAFLFLCKAKEVDARIDEDLTALSKLKAYATKKHSYDPPVVGVATQVDELDPAEIVDPPYEDEEKQRNISAAREILWQKMKAGLEDTVEVIPVSAYMRFQAGNVICDRRWNVGKLLLLLVVNPNVPLGAKVGVARIAKVKSVQKKMARILVGSAATTAGLIGATPIPLVDLPLITGVQVGMIVGIGYVAGRELTKKSAVEFMSAIGLDLGGAFALRELARALVKLVPVAGNVVSGAIAAAATWGIGEAAIAYFIEGKSAEEVKRVYERERKKREEEGAQPADAS